MHFIHFPSLLTRIIFWSCSRGDPSRLRLFNPLLPLTPELDLVPPPISYIMVHGLESRIVFQ